VGTEDDRHKWYGRFHARRKNLQAMFIRQCPFMFTIIQSQRPKPISPADMERCHHKYAKRVEVIESDINMAKHKTGVWWFIYRQASLRFSLMYRTIKVWLNYTQNHDSIQTDYIQTFVTRIGTLWASLQTPTVASPETVKSFQQNWKAFRIKLFKVKHGLPFVTICQVYLMELHYMNNFLALHGAKRWKRIVKHYHERQYWSVLIPNCVGGASLRALPPPPPPTIIIKKVRVSNF
jgi:hypothetical protein